MARTHPGMSLDALLIRLIWLCVGPLVLLAAYLAVDRVRQVHDERRLEATQLAKTLATAVDQDLNARIAALKMLAESPLVDDASRWKDLYQEAQGFRRSFGSHVILADLQMHMLFNTRVPFGSPLPMLPRPKGRAAAPIAAESGRPAVGDTFEGPLATLPLVAVAVPALRDGKTVALLLTVFEAHQFQKHMDPMALPSAWSLALLDGNGATIARRSPPGLDPAADVDASGRFVVKSAASPWSVALEIPRDVYRAPLLEAAVVLALAVLGATLAGVVGGTLAGRRLGRSVTSLAQPSAPGSKAPGITEIATVRRLLDEAAQRREAAEVTSLASEQRFRRLFYEGPLPQALIARDGTFVDLNARFEQVFGYSLEDVPTLSDWWPRAYPDPAARSSAIDAWNAAVARVGATTTPMEPAETRVTCKSGAVRAMVISGIGIGNDFLATFFDVTERRRVDEARQRLAAIVESSDDAIVTVAERRDAELQRLVAEQATRERLLRDLTSRLRTLREEECTRISREVHDGLGQLLTCLKMDIRWMIRRLTAGAAAEDLLAKLAETEALVDQTVASVQRIAVELRPSVLDALGLPAAIRDEARRFEDRSGVITVVEAGTSAPPDRVAATTLFRILQELLTNAARHAHASSLHITLADEAAAWVMRVRDNGVGIPVEMTGRVSSLGLLGMIERAEAIGGTFCVERLSDGGTLATVTIPRPPDTESRHAARSDR